MICSLLLFFFFFFFFLIIRPLIETALREAKKLHSFGCSEYNRVKKESTLKRKDLVLRQHFFLYELTPLRKKKNETARAASPKNILFT